MTKSEKSSSRKLPAAIMWLSVISVLICASIFVYTTPYIIQQWSDQDRPAQSVGEFADQFGLTNAVFSGLALFFVAITLILQTRELKLQRREIDESQDIYSQQKEMLERQAMQMEAQSKLLERQVKSNDFSNFENSFFNLHNAFREIQTNAQKFMVNEANNINSISQSLRASMLSDRIKPPSDLDRILSRLTRRIEDAGFKPKQCEDDPKALSPEFARLCACAAYRRRRIDILPNLSPYYRLLEIILIHIETLPERNSLQDNLLYKDKSYYYDIVFSVISLIEQRFIAMHCDLGMSPFLANKCRKNNLFGNYRSFTKDDRYICSRHFLESDRPIVEIDG